MIGKASPPTGRYANTNVNLCTISSSNLVGRLALPIITTQVLCGVIYYNFEQMLSLSCRVLLECSY